MLLSVFLLFTAGCAETYTVFHSQTGEPLYLGRRAYSYDGCLDTMRQEAAERGVTFRAIHVRGSWEGRSLLWPFEPGYACEAAIGPERLPSGPYLNVPPRTPQG
jgi:hypothetical protein